MTTDDEAPASRPLLQLVLDVADAYRGSEDGALDNDSRPYLRTELEGVLVDALTRGRKWRSLLPRTALMLAACEDVESLKRALADPTQPYQPLPTVAVKEKP